MSSADEKSGAGRYELTASDIESINKVMSDNNRELLPEEASVPVETPEGKVEVLDSDGNPVRWTAAPQSPQMSQRNAVTDHIKRVVGACLGIDFTAHVSAWAAIEASVNTWDKAAKFVLRRVGFIAALTCGGGIFAEYLL